MPLPQLSNMYWLIYFNNSIEIYQFVFQIDFEFQNF